MTRPAARHETLYVRNHDACLRVRRIKPRQADRHAAPLVFLHEGLGCIELSEGFPRTTLRGGRPGRRHLRPQGYGESSHLDGKWPPDYQETEAMVYLPEVLDHCGISSAVLIGHSDGGSIALIAGATPPGPDLRDHHRGGPYLHRGDHPGGHPRGCGGIP